MWSWLRFLGLGIDVRSAGVRNADLNVNLSLRIPIGMPDADDRMILSREIFTNNSTIGSLYLDGQFQCYSLELSARKQSGVKNCIPAGKYEIKMEWSTRFHMITPHLQDVPGRTFIEIHPGNKPADTEGCILLGNSRETDWIGNSRVAYGKLIPKIEDRLKAGKLYIEITGNA